MLSNAESSWLTECFSLYNAHPDTHTRSPPGSCGEKQKCKRTKDEPREEQTSFYSFPDGHSDLGYCSFPIFFSRGVSCSLISRLRLSLVEPKQTPHSAFKGQGLPASGRQKNVNFQRQNCSLSFITPPPGVNIKLFQVCQKQGKEWLVDSGLRREGVTAALLVWKQGRCRHHRHLCLPPAHQHRLHIDRKAFAVKWMKNRWCKSPCSLVRINSFLLPSSFTARNGIKTVGLRISRFQTLKYFNCTSG